MITFKDHDPATFEEAVNLLVTTLTDDEVRGLRAGSPSHYHHGFGTAMRNAWLWDEKHPLSSHMRARFDLKHADDLSGLILSAVHARVCGTKLDIEAEVKRYKEHWLKYTEGFTSA